MLPVVKPVKKNGNTARILTKDNRLQRVPGGLVDQTPFPPPTVHAGKNQYNGDLADTHTAVDVLVARPAYSAYAKKVSLYIVLFNRVVSERLYEGRQVITPTRLS